MKWRERERETSGWFLISSDSFSHFFLFLIFFQFSHHFIFSEMVDVPLCQVSSANSTFSTPPKEKEKEVGFGFDVLFLVLVLVSNAFDLNLGLI
jgi:hypothetical protein